MRRAQLALATVIVLAACASESSDGAFLDHDEPADFDPVDLKGDGVAAVFDRRSVVEQEFFDDTTTVAATDVQAFLERTPYGTRSFLADESVGTRSFAEALVEVSIEFELNPVMLLARLQVEQGLISRTSRPSTQKVDFALGCGCPDGGGCSAAFRGIDRQLACAADVLRTHADASAAGVSEWRVGTSTRTLDGISISPANDATAALYAYTPWVLQGQGGNWLVWNVTKKFVQHFETELLPPADFVGSACSVDDADACDFEDGDDAGFCHAWVDHDGQTTSLCSLDCAGFCPDRAGLTTFCVELEPGVGGCVLRATEANDRCSAIAGTQERELPRFVGDSSAASTTAMVCVPATTH